MYFSHHYLLADLALVAQELLLVDASDVHLQKTFMMQHLSTVGTFYIFSDFALVERQVMVQFLLCEELLLLTSWTFKDLIHMLEHVLPHKMLAGEEVRAMLTEVAILQEVHVISAQVPFHLFDALKSQTAAVATDNSLS